MNYTNKKALLVDTNLSSIPIYKYLTSLGLKVYVIGGNPNDSLAKSCPNYVQMNYSDISATEEFLRREKIDYLIPGCNDQSYRICAELNKNKKYFGIESLDITDIINKKDQFRILSEKLEFPIPKVILENQYGTVWPVIVKPVDSYSGRGNTVLYEKDAANLQDAISRAKEFSKTSSFLIEEYVTGQLYSHSAFIINEEIAVDFVVEEFCTANPFVVDTSRVVYDFPLKILNEIRICIRKLAKSLNLVDGLIHTQFIATKESFWLIEITRRCPGDLYSQLIEFSTGFKYSEVYTQPFINIKLNIKKLVSKKNFIIRHTLSLDKEQYFESLKFNFPVNIYKFISMSTSGDLIKPSPFSRIALIFLFNSSEEEHVKLYDEVVKRNLYTLNVD